MERRRANFLMFVFLFQRKPHGLSKNKAEDRKEKCMRVDSKSHHFCTSVFWRSKIRSVKAHNLRNVGRGRVISVTRDRWSRTLVLVPEWNRSRSREQLWSITCADAAGRRKATDVQINA